MINAIKELLKRPVAYQPVIAKAIGSVKLTILWCQLYYWSDKTNDPDGWIYKTRTDIFNETGMKRKEQETARKIGIELGVLECKVVGMPPKVNFKIDEERMIEIIEAYIKNNPKNLTPVSKEGSKSAILPTDKELNTVLKTMGTPHGSPLPGWLDKEAWSEWEQYRKEIKKKLTPLTIKQQIRFLEKNKNDHIEIINTSISNGWTGLFPIKKQYKSQNNYTQDKKGKIETIKLPDGTETSVILEDGQDIEIIRREVFRRYNNTKR